jgi:hypothetical protein
LAVDCSSLSALREREVERRVGRFEGDSVGSSLISSDDWSTVDSSLSSDRLRRPVVFSEEAELFAAMEKCVPV